MCFVIKTPTIALQGSSHDPLHFTNEEPEASRGKILCPRSYTSVCQSQDLSPASLASCSGAASSNLVVFTPSSNLSHRGRTGPSDSLLMTRGKVMDIISEIRLQRDGGVHLAHTPSCSFLEPCLGSKPPSCEKSSIVARNWGAASGQQPTRN